MKIYTHALTRHPQDPTLLGRLGVAAARRGDPAEARRLERALAALSAPYVFGRHTYGIRNASEVRPLPDLDAD